MKKTVHVALLGTLVLITTACTITPPRVAVSGPTISIPDVFVIGDQPYRSSHDNVRFESHDRRDFGRSHRNQRWNRGYNDAYGRGGDWGARDSQSHR